MGTTAKQVTFHGLRENDLKIIINTLVAFPEVEKAVFFGSRAKGNYRTGSDVDICISGYKVSQQTCTRIRYLLNEELLLPYFFDVLHYEKISNQNLKDHIDKVGILFYPPGSHTSS